jgi:hypothetical protein
MSTAFQCDDKEALIAYLYDEVEPERRREISAHLRACSACADEIEALRDVRRDLAAWQPPEAELNFAVVPKSATVLRRYRQPSRTIPGWLQAAAAVLLVAGGLAIANVQVRYDESGVTVSTGWMNRSEGTLPTATAPTPASDADWKPALTALADDLRREIQMVRSTQSTPAPQSETSVDADALLRRVEALVAESERRQRQELAVRMAQFGRDVQSDLFRINQGFRHLQGRTGLVEGNQREIVNLVNQVRRASTQQVP